MTLEEENKELRELLAFFIVGRHALEYSDKRMKVRAHNILNINNGKI